MGQAIGDVLPFAVGVAVSPIPIIGVILVLFSGRARTNGPAFLIGWVAGLAVLSAAVYWVAHAGDVDSDRTASDTMAWVKIGLGALLTHAAWRKWRTRPAPGAEPQLPRWMTALDDFSAVKALGLGVLLSAVNPKNLALTVGAAATVAQDVSSTDDAVVGLVVFVVLASVSVATPVLMSLFGGDRVATTLTGWKEWLGANNAAVMAVLFVVFGAVLIGQGVRALG
jgi:hypothetical protein